MTITVQELAINLMVSIINAAYLTPVPELSAVSVACQVSPRTIATVSPLAGVAPVKVGSLPHEAVDVKTFTRNWTGTLLMGVVLLVVAKSSTCSATAYHPAPTVLGT